jgi:hypothetical protein
MPDSRPAWKWQRMKLPLADRRCGVPLQRSKFSEEMTCCGSKKDFCKKSGTHLIRAKGQTHPDSSEIGRSMGIIQKINSNICTNKRELICVSQVVYYLCRVLFPAFHLLFGSCLTKTRFWHSVNGKHTFRRTKQKSAFVTFLTIPRATCVSDMASFWQTMPWSGPNLAHLT